MKKTFALIILSFCVCISMKAQEQKKKSVNEIDISYYNTHIGQNIAAEYNRNFGKHTLVIGIKYHLNHNVGITQSLSNNDTFRKHFYARKFPDHIGFSLGYEYHLRDINPYVSPYLLYNLQYARMPTKHLWANNESQYGYKYNQVYQGPFIALENTIGAGFSVKLTDRLSLNQSGGVNLPFFYNEAPSLNYVLPDWNFDGVSYQWRAGLTLSL